MANEQNWRKELNLGPWFDRQQVARICKLLSENNYRQVQEIFRIWRTETMHCPTYVIGTSMVIDAIIHYDHSNRDVGILTAMYLQILTKFLSLCCPKYDSPVRKSRHYHFAEWIFKIDYNYNHNGEIPTLNTIKLALRHCLNWLLLQYWNKQDAYLSLQKAQDLKRVTELKLAIELFCELITRNYIHENSIVNLRNMGVEYPHFLEKLKKIPVHVTPSTGIRTVAVQLLRFIRSKLNKRVKYMFSDIVVTTVVNTGHLFVMLPYDQIRYLHTDNFEELPSNLTAMWDGLIDLLLSSQLLVPFITSLLFVMNNVMYNHLFRKLASLWTYHILQRILLTQIRLNMDTQLNVKLMFTVFPNLKNVTPFEHCREDDEIFKNMKAISLEIMGNINIYNIRCSHCLLYICKYPLVYINSFMNEFA